ncbi:MAG: hypothetical protein ACM3YE_10985 [Bacteroidota bacterium]
MAKERWTKEFKKRLIDLDLTLLQLAEDTGISYKYLRLISSGQRSPGKHAPVIAKRLGISIDILDTKKTRGRKPKSSMKTK